MLPIVGHYLLLFRFLDLRGDDLLLPMLLKKFALDINYYAFLQLWLRELSSLWLGIEVSPVYRVVLHVRRLSKLLEARGG